MRKICVINQKGGVGKTTTTVTLAHGLAKAGRRVLVIDFDPQGNISQATKMRAGKDVYNFLVEDASFDLCVQRVAENCWIMPAKETLTKAELILAGEAARETYLKRKLSKINNFDYIFIDCPPSLGLLNQNALVYADEAIIPTSTDALGVDALQKMLDAIETLNDVFGHSLTVSAIIPTLYDTRIKTCREHLVAMQNKYYELVTNPVRLNSKLREAPSAHTNILDYAKYSRGAKDYKQIIDFITHQEEVKQELPPVAVETGSV